MVRTPSRESDAMMQQEATSLTALLEAIEEERRRPAILYCTAVSEETIPPLYECLSHLGHVDSLDLIIGTAGGSVTVARQVAVLLRQFTNNLTIVVPHMAKSAGTLICLAADELILGALAELGPIDAHMGTSQQPVNDAPGLVSAEDVRLFRSMASDWFGVDRDEDRLQVLALVSQRIFPASLAAFYRYDKLARDIASELLEYQLPGLERAELRHRIVDKLVSGYHSHDYPILRDDIQELGLRAVRASPSLEGLLWRISQVMRPSATERFTNDGSERVVGAIGGLGLMAEHVVRQSPDLPQDKPTGIASGWESKQVKR